jgi:hypothetical protein
MVALVLANVLQTVGVDSRGGQPVPRTPPREWWDHCTRGVEKSGSAFNPGDVCGALWFHKMTPAQRAAATRAHEGNPGGHGMRHPKGHKKGCRCPFCKLYRKKHGGSTHHATKAHRKPKRRAAHHVTRKAHRTPHLPSTPSTAYMHGFREGHADCHAGKPLRKVSGHKGPYAKGYSAGCRIARVERKHHRRGR